MQQYDLPWGFLHIKSGEVKIRVAHRTSLRTRVTAVADTGVTAWEHVGTRLVAGGTVAWIRAHLSASLVSAASVAGFLLTSVSNHLTL